MPITRRDVLQERRGRLHVQPRGAGVPVRSRPRAGGLEPQSGRAQLSGGNDGLSTARALHRSVLLQPAADARPFRPARAPGWQRFERQRARPASGADRDCRTSSTRGAWRDPARRLRQLEPIAFHGTDIWSTANPSNTHGAGGSAGIWRRCRRPPIRCVAMEHGGDTPQALQSPTVSVASIPASAHTRSTAPNTGSRSRARADGRAEHRVARAGGSAASSPSSQRPRRRRMDTLDRVAVRRSVQAERRLSEQRVRTGASGGRRRDGEGHRHQGVLRADGRLRHACVAGHQRRPTART